METIRWLVHEDRRRKIKEIAAIVNVSYGTVETILTCDLNMHRVAAKFESNTGCTAEHASQQNVVIRRQHLKVEPVSGLVASGNHSSTVEPDKPQRASRLVPSNSGSKPRQILLLDHQCQQFPQQ